MGQLPVDEPIKPAGAIQATMAPQSQYLICDIVKRITSKNLQQCSYLCRQIKQLMHKILNCIFSAQNAALRYFSRRNSQPSFELRFCGERPVSYKCKRKSIFQFEAAGFAENSMFSSVFLQEN